MDNQEQVTKLFFTIGEVAEQLNVSTSLIRFWEKEFKQLEPRKTKGGTRKFSAEDVLLLKRIYQLVKIEGYTISGAKDRLKEKTNAPITIEMVKIKLTEIKRFLLELKQNIS